MLQYVTPHVPIAAGPINEKSVMDKKNGGICFCSSSGPVCTCETDDKPALMLTQEMLISQLPGQ